MLKVGLTGGIGSGKTTVSDLFKSLNINVIDTDVIARGLLEDNPAVLHEVIERFGSDNVTTNGKLDRKKLASNIFHSESNKQKLEKILHPRIRLEVARKIQKLNTLAEPPAYIIIVVPLLFETNFQDLVDRTLVVMADKETRITRVRRRDNRSVDEIRSIIAHQVDDTLRQNGADDIIINNRDSAALQPLISDLDSKYTQLADSYK